MHLFQIYFFYLLQYLFLNDYCFLFLVIKVNFLVILINSSIGVIHLYLDFHHFYHFCLHFLYCFFVNYLVFILKLIFIYQDFYKFLKDYFALILKKKFIS